MTKVWTFMVQQVAQWNHFIIATTTIRRLGFQILSMQQYCLWEQSMQSKVDKNPEFGIIFLPNVFRYSNSSTQLSGQSWQESFLCFAQLTLSCEQFRDNDSLCTVSMIDFLELYEKQKKKEEDRIYFSEAFDKKGRRYSQDFETELKVVASGGFGFLRLSKLKKNPSDKTFLTKVISKDTVCGWQLRNKTLIEADILSNINHENIVQVSFQRFLFLPEKLYPKLSR